MSLSPVQPTVTTHTFEMEGKQDPMALLPRDMMMKVFSYLKPQELGRCSQVNRQWCILASDDSLWKALNQATIFGQKQWEIYFGDVGAEPPLPPNIYKILKSRCPFWAGKRVDETHLLVLVPEAVNGKPLTLKSLEELVKSPKQGNASQYKMFDIKQYTDAPASKSHWVLMTRDVIPNSFGKGYTQQQTLVANYAQTSQAPYEVPHILDAVVAIWMHYVTTGIRLYSTDPWAYTKCQETDGRNHWRLTVGGFSSEGLFVAWQSGCADTKNGVGGARLL